jgi:hypothetical protein
MSDIAFTKDYNADQLLLQFGDAGHGAKIKCIRNFNPVSEGVYANGEIVHDGTLTQGQADAVINAHTPAATNRDKLHGQKVTDAIALAKAGNLTNAQAQKCIAFILEYMRSEDTTEPE